MVVNEYFMNEPLDFSFLFLFWLYDVSSSTYGLKNSHDVVAVGKLQESSLSTFIS